jgi:Domain of unknown function (DUF4158)
VQAEWEPDELIGAWTLTGGDWDLIANKAGVTRLGFAVMLKFYEIEGRFPAYPEEVPPAAVRYLGSLVKVDPALFAKYSWAGRSVKYHRSQIRKVYGTRPPTEDDEDRWAQWLAEEICPTETNRDRLAAALRRRCLSEKVEPPSTGQVGVPVAIAENPTNPPLTCGDVVLFGLGQRVLCRAAGSASAVTWAEVCSPSWTYRPRLPRCRCRDLAWSSGAVRPPAARCWRAEWRSWWSVQPSLCGSWAAVACLNRYSARG